MSTKIGAVKIIKSATGSNSGSVIFFHGSGDTGAGILEWVKFVMKDFSLPHVNFLFPTAPTRPYTPLGGELSHVWFDRRDITPEVPEHMETLESIGAEVKLLISKEVEAGIPLNKIIVGGFSMGGALALHTAYRFMPGLGGVFALSSFLNNESIVFDALKESKGATLPPLLMCHGDRDMLVPLSWGKNSYEKLTDLGVKGEFISVKNTMHELKKTELQALLVWINKIIP